MAALIIAGDNLQFKSVKKTYGMEGEGFIANIYLNNKKVGVYNDFADGSGGYPVFDTVEAEKRVDSLIAEWTAKSTDKAVKIAGSVRIDEHAFSRADICHLIFDKNIRAQISETAFADTKIKELDIPEHLYKQYKLIWDKIE